MKDENKRDNLVSENTVEEGTEKKESKFKKSSNGNNQGNGNNFYKKVWFWVLVVIAVVGVGGTSAYAQHKENTMSQQIASAAQKEQAQAQNEVQGQANEQNQNSNNDIVSKSVVENSINGINQSISIKSTGNILNENPNENNSTAKEVTLKPGDYIVGKDNVMPGYYKATVTGTGEINISDSVGNESLTGKVTEGSNSGIANIEFQLNENERIHISGFQEVKLTPYVHKYLSTLNPGTYVVGQSVKAGKYTAEVPAGEGSISVIDPLGIPLYNEMTTTGQNNGQSQKITLNLEAGDTINVNGISGIKLIPVSND